MDRRFLFIDETGDPGHPDQRDASRYYQLNILAMDRPLLGKLSREFSRFRYFTQADKELEKYVSRHMQIFMDIVRGLSMLGVSFYSFCLTKENYVGPYLNGIGRERFDYNPKLFRNFIIRRSLEIFFQEQPAQPGQEIELVIDRFLHNEEEEMNLKKYLRGNYHLPSFLHIVQVDSMHSDAIQVVDIFGSLVKKRIFDGEKPLSHLDFSRIYEMENPNSIKRKNPDTH